MGGLETAGAFLKNSLDWSGPFQKMDELVTAITVNFKTPSLIAQCVESFILCYPGVPYIVVDNGGCAESLAELERISARHSSVRPVRNEQNIGHGAALDQGAKLASTKYVFTLDSDAKVIKHGFLEAMVERFRVDPLLFAVGWMRYVGDTGVATPHQEMRHGKPCIHPYAMMFDRESYFQLPQFDQSGAPTAPTMFIAVARGFHLESFPIEQFIWHKTAGTRGMFGGRWIVPTDSKPGPWASQPI